MQMLMTSPNYIPATRRMHVGKELEQFESLRFYDPLLVRFTTPDPLALSFPFLSPYAYCANNPVNNVDLDGMRILKSSQNTDAENCIIANEGFTQTSLY